jgi:hypothetical protein
MTLIGLLILLLIIQFQYSKCLGNKRPASLVRLENVIWKAIFDIACGAINVYDAAQLIAQAIPDILEDSRDDDGSLQ